MSGVVQASPGTVGADGGAVKRYRRHAAEVTADRLKEHYERWFDRLDGSEQHDISHVIQILEEIAEGQR